MTVLLDTSVLFAHHDADAGSHEVATRAMAAVLGGSYGQPLTTDYIYDEVLTLARSRSDVETAKRLGRRIRGADEFPSAIDLQFLGPEGFRRAVTVFEEYDDQDLSFTDATIISHMERKDVDFVLTFDDDFDGIVDRLDPRDVA